MTAFQIFHSNLASNDNYENQAIFAFENLNHVNENVIIHGKLPVFVNFLGEYLICRFFFCIFIEPLSLDFYNIQIKINWEA